MFRIITAVLGLVWAIAGELPADSVLTAQETGVLERIVITPIQWWQHLSYSTSLLHCQFEPSCSSYMAQAISQRGIVPGLFIGADRIVRCNPAALHYHLQTPQPTFTVDGRMIDPVPHPQPFSLESNSALAAGFSLVPGLGRVYAGHTWDGIFSFLTVSSLAILAHNAHSQGAVTASVTLGTGALIFWLGDIYGAVRTAEISNF